MKVENEIAKSDSAYVINAAEAGSAQMLRNYSEDIIVNGNNSGGGNNNGGGGNKNGGGNNNISKGNNNIGKGNNSNNNTNNNVVDILDLAVPQSKVRPIDRLLDRYDWSSTSMTPLLQPQPRPRRPAPSQPHQPSAPLPSRRLPPPSQKPPPTPPPPTRPPRCSDFSARRRQVRKSLWKRARELIGNCVVRVATRAVSYCRPR